MSSFVMCFGIRSSRRSLMASSQPSAGTVWYLMLFGDCIGQRGILHLRGQIQQLLDLCAFACIVGINGFRSLGFQLVQHPEPQGAEAVKYA